MKNDIPLKETNIAGRGTREWVVRGNSGDQRDWLANAPLCAALAQRHIVHVGVAEACHPYRVVRRDLGGTFLMACTGGEGRVWLDGRWRKISAGEACLAPPHAVHAYGTVPDQPWKFAWVRYQEPAGRRPMVTVSSPVLAVFDGQPLMAAVMGLFHEASGGGGASPEDAWISLIEYYVRQFTHLWREDDRLRQLWEAVEADLAADWSVERLAGCVGLSSQQLRRLCRQQLGRKPAEQIAYLRIRKAATLLTGGKEKIDTIAHAVGYRSSFSFSSAFKRFLNCRPSEYRGG